MTGVTLTDTGYNVSDLPRGGLLHVAGCKPEVWTVLKVNSATSMTVAPWTWISKVISWNPCNDLNLMANIWR